MHENMKIKSKGRAKESYRFEEREILQKLRRKTTKIPMWSLANAEREKKFEKVLNRNFEKVRKEPFKKAFSRCSIDRKSGSIDRNTQSF